MALWWVARTGGAGSPIRSASQAPTLDAQEGPINDASDTQLQTFLNPRPLNVIPFSVFIGRYTDAEYTSLMQKRATAITAGNVSLVKQWDQAMSMGEVDLNSTAAQTFKAAIVSAAVLTQARADVIFS